MTTTPNLEEWITRSREILEQKRREATARFEAQKDEIRREVEENLRGWLGE